jgi:hypothetical protein
MKPGNDFDSLSLPDALGFASSKRGIVILSQRQAPAADQGATSARRPDILNPEFRRPDVARRRSFCEIKHCPAPGALRLLHRRPRSFPYPREIAGIYGSTPSVGARLSV